LKLLIITILLINYYCSEYVAHLQLLWFELSEKRKIIICVWVCFFSFLKCVCVFFSFLKSWKLSNTWCPLMLNCREKMYISNWWPLDITSYHRVFQFEWRLAQTSRLDVLTVFSFHPYLCVCPSYFLHKNGPQFISIKKRQHPSGLARKWDGGQMM